MTDKMQVHKFDTEDAWLEFRKGRITGTRLKDFIVRRGSDYKIGFYEVLAERIALPPSEENVMDRGKRLEEYAIEAFAQKTGKKVTNELVVWTRSDDDNIALSPDGVIGKTEACEVKCLSSARHIEAYVKQEIPSEYWEQVLQYFIVNDALKTLYFVFYDPRMPIDMFYIPVKRENLSMQVAEYLQLERDMLARLKELEDKLTFAL